MTNHTQPKAVQRFLHVAVRDCYFPSDADFTEEEAGAHLEVVFVVNKNEQHPQYYGSVSHLYTEEFTVPVPSFDPVEKRLDGVDQELAQIRTEFYRRKEELEEKRHKILALSHLSAN